MASRSAVDDVSSSVARDEFGGARGVVHGLSRRLLGCRSWRAAVVETRAVSRAAVRRSDGDPIVVDSLPEGERRVVRVAIDEGRYRDCPVADPTIPEPIRSFAQRASDRTGEDGRGPVHLDDDGRYYAVGVNIEDQMYVSLPDDTTSDG